MAACVKPTSPAPYAHGGSGNVPPLLAAVVAYAATAALALEGIVATLVFSVVSFAVNFAFQQIGFGQKDPPTFSLAEKVRGRTQMVRQPVVPRRLIYGEAEVSGPVVFMESNDVDGADNTPNELFYIAIVLASHECESVTNIMLGDKPLANFGSHAVVTSHLGTVSQAASATLLGAPSWTTSHQLLGLCYLAARLKFNPDLFPSGLPNIKATVRGKKVLDPRDSLVKWTVNPALCIADYLMDSDVGFGAKADEIDFPSVMAAANICEELVANPNGGTQPRYTLNGTIDSDITREQSLNAMLSAMAGRVVYISGKFHMFAGAWSVPTKTLTESDLRASVTVIPRFSRAELANSVRGVYFQKQTGQLTDFPPVTDPIFVEQDNDEEIWTDIELPFTEDSGEAQRLAKIELQRMRRQQTVRFPAKWIGLGLRTWDTVNLTLPRFGFSSKPFRIVGWTLSDDRTGVDLELREEDAGVWSWAAGDGSSVNVPAPPSTADPFTMDPPSNLVVTKRTVTRSDGSTDSQLVLTWDAPATPFLNHYDVQIKPVAEADWQPVFPVPRDFTSWQINALEMSVNYDFRIRAVSALGIRSAWASTSATADADQTAPGDPTSLIVVGGFRQLSVRFKSPTDADLSHVKVFVRTNATAPTAVDQRAAGTGAPGADNEIVIADLNNSATYFVWVQAVDRSGNAGALVGPVSAATQRILADDIADTILTTAKFAQGLEPIAIVSALPNPVGYVGESVVLLTTDLKVYRYDPVIPSFVRDVDGTDLTLDSIGAGVIKAGAISATEIAAGAISADKLAANSVTAANGAIEDLAVVQGKIANASIGTAQIINAAVDTLQIAGQAVTVPVSALTVAGIAIGTGYTTVQQVTLDPSSSPVSIMFSAFLRFLPIANVNTSPSFRLTRNGTVIWSFENAANDGFCWGGGWYIPLAFGVFDSSPVVGNNTYAMQVRKLSCSGNLGSVDFENRYLQALATKR